MSYDHYKIKEEDHIIVKGILYNLYNGNLGNLGNFGN